MSFLTVNIYNKCYDNTGVLVKDMKIVKKKLFISINNSFCLHARMLFVATFYLEAMLSTPSPIDPFALLTQARIYTAVSKFEVPFLLMAVQTNVFKILTTYISINTYF